MQTARAAALPRFMLAWFAIQVFFSPFFWGGQRIFAGPKSFPQQKIYQFRQGMASLRFDIPTTRGNRKFGMKKPWVDLPTPTRRMRGTSWLK